MSWRQGLGVVLITEILGMGSWATRAGVPDSLPPDRLTILTHLSGAAEEGGFGQHAIEINRAYSLRHDFGFFVAKGDGKAADRDVRWSKLNIISDFLEADAAKGTRGAVLWMDSDAAFTNFNFSALSIVQQMNDEGADIALCKDLSPPKEATQQTCAPVCLNTGVMVLMNTEWTRSFVRSWWQAAEQDFPSFRHGKDHEESVLAQVYSRDLLQVRKKTLVLKPLDLNSVPPFYKEHDARQPVIHLSDTPDLVRTAVLSRLAALVRRDQHGVVHLDIESVVQELELLTIEAYRGAWALGSTDARVPLVLAAAEREGGRVLAALELLERAVELASNSAVRDNSDVRYDATMAHASLLASTADGSSSSTAAASSSSSEEEERWCGAASGFLRASRLVPTSAQTATMLRNANARCAQAKMATGSRDKRYALLLRVVMVAGGAALVAAAFLSRTRAHQPRAQHRDAASSAGTQTSARNKRH